VVADPIHLQMGNGENELVINIEEDGINYIWTKKTYWKMTDIQNTCSLHTHVITIEV
jgi:hypothetical protein